MVARELPRITKGVTGLIVVQLEGREVVATTKPRLQDLIELDPGAGVLFVAVFQKDSGQARVLYAKGVQK